MNAVANKPRAKAKPKAPAKGTTREARASAPESTPTTATGPATFFATVGLQQICGRVNEAVALIDIYSEHYSSDVCWGASRLLDTAAVAIAKAISSRDVEDAAEGVAILCEAMATMQMFADVEGNAAVRGVITLVQLAKNDLDGILPRLS